MIVADLKIGTVFVVDGGTPAEYTLLKLGAGSAYVRCRRIAVTEPPDEDGSPERRRPVVQEFTIGLTAEVHRIISEPDAATGGR